MELIITWNISNNHNNKDLSHIYGNSHLAYQYEVHKLHKRHIF